MQGRIDVPAAGPHDQALQRGKPHGGVDAPAVFYGRDAGPVAEMQGDQVYFLQGPSQVPGRFLGHKEVGGAVKAIAADLMIFIEFIRKGIVIGVGRQGLVKHGVEDRHLGHLGKRFPQDFDPQQIGRVVERGQRNKPPDGLNYFFSNSGRFLEKLPPMNHPVPDAE